MKNAIILHGQPGRKEYYDPNAPSMSNAHWIPWLQGQLLKKDIAAVTPEVPNAFEPEWELWKQEVERFEVTPNTIVVGHSRGGEFWLRYLSENSNITVGKVVLVAPSLGWYYNDKHYFGSFEIDPDLVKRTKSGVTVLHSDNDGEGIQKSVEEIRNTIKDLKYQEFHLGHFTYGSMQTEKFPELLEECLNEEV